ncbi:MAG: hypothetical protein WKF96_08305 [Solirubrobacteraceae bacterium]
MSAFSGPAGNVRAVARSVLESVVNRPFKPRDRILRATSLDGTAFVADPRFRLTHPAHGRDHMTYSRCEDEHGRLWARASLLDAGQWSTEITDGRRWHSVAPLGLRHLMSPSWSGARLYGIGIDVDDVSRPVCFARGASGWPEREVAQHFETAAGGLGPQDLWVVASPGGQTAFGTITAPRGSSIHRWISTDGATWAYAGEAVQAQNDDAFLSDPCVVRTPDGWRMFLRAGRTPVLGARIRSAVASDPAAWRLEDGDRISPGGRWASHGVGFPFARVDEAGWELYYTGFWGACRASQDVARRWSLAEAVS